VAFETPITINAALDHIHRHEYVLPAIQREFVWRTDQIERRARLTPARLKISGIEAEEAVRLQEMGERLPNLQLLEGSVNIAKNDSSPRDWAVKHYPEETSRNSYLARHTMGVLPEDAHGVGEFIDGRRERMRAKLTAILHS